MGRLLTRVFLLLFATAWCSAAVAQDECKDVLINKVMDTLSITKDNYYNTAILSTLDEKTDEDKKKKLAGGLEIEGIPGSPAWATLPVVLFLKTIPTDGGKSNTVTYSTYLPPRAQLVGESRPWPSNGPALTKGTYAGQYAVYSPQECFDASEGYVFVESSIVVESRPTTGATLTSCGSNLNGKTFILDPSGKRICVKQFNGAPTPGDHNCALGVTATEATVKWIPPPPAAQ